MTLAEIFFLDYLGGLSIIINLLFSERRQRERVNIGKIRETQLVILVLEGERVVLTKEFKKFLET